MYGTQNTVVYTTSKPRLRLLCIKLNKLPLALLVDDTIIFIHDSILPIDAVRLIWEHLDIGTHKVSQGQLVKLLVYHAEAQNEQCYGIGTCATVLSK